MFEVFELKTLHILNFLYIFLWGLDEMKFYKIRIFLKLLLFENQNKINEIR